MRRLIFALCAACVAAASSASFVFFDDFETGDFTNWDGTTGSGSDPGSVQNSVVYQGNFSARMSGSTTSGVVSGRYANFTSTGAAQPLFFDFYMKLGAASGNNRHFAEIRSYAGDAYLSGSLEQLLAMGAYNAPTNKIDASGNVSNGSNGSKWQVRTAFAGYANNGWFVLDQAANRTTDWTHFRMEIGPNTLQVYVDGVAGLAAPISRGNSSTIDCMVFSSRLSSVNNDGYFDNMGFGIVPEPSSLAVVGIGLLPFCRRRR